MVARAEVLLANRTPSVVYRVTAFALHFVGTLVSTVCMIALMFVTVHRMADTLMSVLVLMAIIYCESYAGVTVDG